MTGISRRALFWAPRALSIAFILFISLFALDAFSEGRGFWGALLAFGIHLVPSLVLLSALVVAWRWEWVGAGFYAVIGALYILFVVPRAIPSATKAVWILTVAGPAFVIAALFLMNWLKRSELRPPEPERHPGKP